MAAIWTAAASQWYMPRRTARSPMRCVARTRLPAAETEAMVTEAEGMAAEAMGGTGATTLETVVEVVAVIEAAVGGAAAAAETAGMIEVVVWTPETETGATVAADEDHL